MEGSSQTMADIILRLSESTYLLIQPEMKDKSPVQTGGIVTITADAFRRAYQSVCLSPKQQIEKPKPRTMSTSVQTASVVTADTTTQTRRVQQKIERLKPKPTMMTSAVQTTGVVTTTRTTQTGKAQSTSFAIQTSGVSSATVETQTRPACSLSLATQTKIDQTTAATQTTGSSKTTNGNESSTENGEPALFITTSEVGPEDLNEETTPPHKKVRSKSSEGSDTNTKSKRRFSGAEAEKSAKRAAGRSVSSAETSRPPTESDLGLVLDGLQSRVRNLSMSVYLGFDVKPTSALTYIRGHLALLKDCIGSCKGSYRVIKELLTRYTGHLIKLVTMLRAQSVERVIEFDRRVLSYVRKQGKWMFHRASIQVEDDLTKELKENRNSTEQQKSDGSCTKQPSDDKSSSDELVSPKVPSPADKRVMNAYLKGLKKSTPYGKTEDPRTVTSTSNRVNTRRMSREQIKILGNEDSGQNEALRSPEVMENDCSQLINGGLLKTPGAGPVNDYPSPPKRRRTPSPQTRGHRKRFSQEKHFPPNGWMNQQAHMIGNQRPYRYNSFYRKNGQFQNHPVNPNAHYRPRMYNNNIYNNNNNSNNNSNNNNNSKNC